MGACSSNASRHVVQSSSMQEKSPVLSGGEVQEAVAASDINVQIANDASSGGNQKALSACVIVPEESISGNSSKLTQKSQDTAGDVGKAHLQKLENFLSKTKETKQGIDSALKKIHKFRLAEDVAQAEAEKKPEIVLQPHRPSVAPAQTDLTDSSFDLSQ
eukprot:TRINITY_DN33895_c0_g1_i1.p1 TRINITY_DN33895_c0_g1~~TRINITY_DN33895_c0_g1_i1.p1  ORF type:complete len:160 (-),score=53.90 TRINITY_DN33895_c0_g1_i1:97-576(-)